MPQKEMRIIAKPTDDRIVLEPAPGALAISGDGGADTYRCGACKTRLMDNVSHHDVFHGEPFDAIKCPKCGKYNELKPEAHHH